MPPLDPKNDVVFKLLFSREKRLLHSMLEAVLGEPIDEVELLNPGIPGDLANDKAIILDLRALLSSGKRVNVEMQVGPGETLPQRFVYYAATDYAAQLRRGEGYHQLEPTVSIVWAACIVVPDLTQLHEVFELRGRETGLLHSDQLTFHVIHLANLDNPGQAMNTALHRWARFFAATSTQELLQLAEEDAIMEAAKTALEDLAQNPEARRLADKREIDRKLYQYELAETARRAAAAAEAETQRAEAETQRAEASLRRVTRRQLEARFGALPDWVDERIAQASLAGLEAISEAAASPESTTVESALQSAAKV